MSLDLGLCSLFISPLFRFLLSPKVCSFELKEIQLELEVYSLNSFTVSFAFHCVFCFAVFAISHHVYGSAL